MEEVYIDIRHTRQQYERAVARLHADPSVCPRNKELLLSFTRDAALGKTIIGRAKKRIGPARLLGYLSQLYPFILYVNKDLDAVTQADVERFVEALDADVIRSRASRNGHPSTEGELLSPRYKADIKVTIKKFYKWLWGQSKVYPPLVEWIDTFVEAKEIAALTETEVERLVDHCARPVHKALVQVLFDGGFRIGELLNIRLRHVEVRNFRRGDPDARCFCLRVPFSKTLRRTVPLPMPASSKWLERWLQAHAQRPVVRPDGTLAAADPEAPLFPISENAVRLLLRRIGRVALNKHVYPHLLRHTSATFWCNRLPYFKFCKRFGWTTTSKMPQRYIDREGIDELSVAELFHDDQQSTLRRENQQLQRELAAFVTDRDVQRQPA